MTSPEPGSGIGADSKWSASVPPCAWIMTRVIFGAEFIESLVCSSVSERKILGADEPQAICPLWNSFFQESLDTLP